MSDQVSVAIIGVGGIVLSQHIQHLAALKNVRLAGYLANKSGRAKQAAGQFGGRLYDDVAQIAADDAIDAVYVSVPPYAHGEIERTLLAAGKALLIEKPIGIDSATADAIGRAAKSAGVVTAVGYHWRYQSTVDELRHRLRDKKVIGGCGFWCGDRPGVWWWRDKATSGGQPTEQTTHVFDLANYLIAARPISVYATGRQLDVYRDAQHTVDDVSVAQVRYDNGVAISVWSSDVMGGSAAKIGLELFTIGGRYDVGFQSLTARDADGVAKIENIGNPYQRTTEAFIHAVATGDRSQIRCDYESALVTHRVTRAVERSIASGKIEAIE